MKAFFIVASVQFAATVFGGEPADDHFAHRPEYVLKEGSVGSPRVDIAWLRVTTESNLEESAGPKICEIKAMVLRSFDAVNRSSHTEFIAEVELTESERTILRDRFVVLHGDRWRDLLTWYEANPFLAGSEWKLAIYGPAEDLAKCTFTVEKAEAQPGATDNPDDAQRLREDH